MNSLEETAAERFQIISPLLDTGMDARQLSAKKNEIAKTCKVSYRTLNRWYKAYLEQGFAGLVPKSSAPQRSSEDDERLQEINLSMYTQNQLFSSKYVPPFFV